MAKRKSKYAMNEEKVQRFLAEGRGQGHGVEYKRWLNVFDFPSKGRIHRFYGLTVPREYHLFSDGEYSSMTQYDWARPVTDIREQYPLDRDLTREIARQEKIKHPKMYDGEDYVLTTDLVLTVDVDGEQRIVARTYKPSKELEKARVREKFEIERRFWAYHNVDWWYVTERNIDKTLVRHVSGLRPFRDLTGFWAPYDGCFRDLAEEVIYMIAAGVRQTLHRCCYDIGRKFDVSPDLVYTAFRHLLVRRFIQTDMLSAVRFPDRLLTEYTLAVTPERIYGIAIR